MDEAAPASAECARLSREGGGKELTGEEEETCFGAGTKEIEFGSGSLHGSNSATCFESTPSLMARSARRCILIEKNADANEGNTQTKQVADVPSREIDRTF